MTAQPIPLRRFYVYVLKNEAGEAFYVGRGTGGRMMQHMARSHNEGVNGRLSEAVAGDERVTAEVVSWHCSVADAASAEKALAKSFPVGQLANLMLTAKPKPKKKLPPAVEKEPWADANGSPMLIDLMEATIDMRRKEARRFGLIRSAIIEGKRLTDVATAAGTSPQRMTQIRRELGMAPRPAGRPRRPAQP